MPEINNNQVTCNTSEATSQATPIIVGGTGQGKTWDFLNYIITKNKNLTFY